MWCVGQGMKGPLAHLEEHTYPCCIPALGEFSEVPPHEGSGLRLAQLPLGMPTELFLLGSWRFWGYGSRGVSRR